MRDKKYFADLVQCADDLKALANGVERNKYRDSVPRSTLDERIAQIRVGEALLRQEAYPSHKPDPLTHYIVMTVSRGYWGKGKTIDEAIKNAKYINSKNIVRVIKCDADATIDEMGGINYYSRCVLGIGTVRKIAGTYVVRGEIGLE